MRLSKYFLLLAVITTAAVFYVSQQVEATKLGYQISVQQLALDEMLDQRQMLLYNVCNLKSPENLQQNFSKKSKTPGDFQILANKQIIILTSAKENSSRIKTAKRPVAKLLDFFGITSLAEAKTQD